MNEIFSGKLALAPLAGFTNIVFRDICARHGADWTVSEMISAKAVCYADKKTLVLAKNCSEVPMALQLFGAEPEFIHRAVKILTSDEYLADNGSVMPFSIDINMGCPVHKIVSNGEGSALMKDSVRAAEIVRAACEASPLPVSVKIRAGYTQSRKNAPEFAQVLEEAGAACICVHGRTREQMYSGEVDLDIIKKVKESVKIPVIGNGDILSTEDAQRMLGYTKCDSLMIGRGALGDPWIFERIKAIVSGGEYREPTSEEKAAVAKEHVLGMCRILGEHRAVPEARKAVGAYFAGFSGAAAARARVNSASSADEVCKIIDGIMLG